MFRLLEKALDRFVLGPIRIRNDHIMLPQPRLRLLTGLKVFLLLLFFDDAEVLLRSLFIIFL